MISTILLVFAGAFFVAFCLITLIGAIGKGMTISEKFAAIHTGIISCLFLIAGLVSGGEL